jgi:formiminotetrahydrofolate cyclodeaminase
MSAIWDKNLTEFRNAIASAAPTPGGGSVAMVAATFGCGLLIMAAEISLARKNVDPETALKLQGSIKILRGYTDKFSSHADQDVAVYQDYVEASKLPKTTQTEMAERDARLEQALRVAADVPVSAAQDILATLSRARELAPFIHSNVISDIGAGAALLHGALEASFYTLQANIHTMKTASEKMRYANLLGNMAKQAEGDGNEIARIVSARLSI